MGFLMKIKGKFRRKTSSEKTAELRQLRAEYSRATKAQALAEEKAKMKKALFEAKYGKYVRIGKKIGKGAYRVGAKLTGPAPRRPRRKKQKRRAVDYSLW